MILIMIKIILINKKMAIKNNEISEVCDKS